jgi:hypothetical protein
MIQQLLPALLVDAADAVLFATVKPRVAVFNNGRTGATTSYPAPVTLHPPNDGVARA